MQWTVPPPLNAAAAVLVTALVFAAGAYFARTGVRTIGAGMFRNHRTGEVIGGWQARALGYFLLVLGGGACVAIAVVFLLSAANRFRAS